MSNDHSIVQPVLIEIKPSKMLSGEIGLFAARALKRNTIIAEAKRLGEYFVPWKKFSGIDATTREKIGHYCLQTEKGFYAPPDFNYLTVPWNMNHSCSYNVGFDEVGNFIIAGLVKRGDELCWDYGMGISDPKFRLMCRCGSSACRKIITGNDWKNVAYMEKNKKYFLRELLLEAQKKV